MLPVYNEDKMKRSQTNLKGKTATRKLLAESGCRKPVLAQKVRKISVSHPKKFCQGHWAENYANIKHSTEALPCRRMSSTINSRIYHLQSHGGMIDVAKPFTHSTLDIFERASNLIGYKGSHNDQTCPRNGYRGHYLIFVIRSDSRISTDFNKLKSVPEGANFEGGGKTPTELSIRFVLPTSVSTSFSKS